MEQQLVKFTPASLRELQLAQLDMLRFFKEFCEKNDITFYFIGGGLIGALRNGGFIPWDDDIDVLLPRSDYERLIRLWQAQYPDGRFRLLVTDGKCSRATFLPPSPTPRTPWSRQTRPMWIFRTAW